MCKRLHQKCGFSLALTLAARLAADDIDWTGGTNGDFTNPLNGSTQQVPGAVDRAAFRLEKLEAEDVSWLGAFDEDFSNELNWSTGRKPGASDRAVFDRGEGAPRRVHLPQAETLGSLLISNNQVELNLRRNSLDLGGADGLRIQPSSPFRGSLITTNGTLLAKLAEILPLSGAEAVAEVSGPSSAWIIAGDIRVGSAEPGFGRSRFRIDAGANVSTDGTLLVEGGTEASGLLEISGNGTRLSSLRIHLARSFGACDAKPSFARASISDGALVTSQLTFLVGGGLSEVTADVFGSGTRIEATRVEVGRACEPGEAMGTLVLRDKATIVSGGPLSGDGASIGHEHGFGTAVVSGSGTLWTNRASTFFVGSYGGRGVLRIEAQARVHTGSVTIGLDGSTADSTNSIGTVTIDGPGSELVCEVDVQLGESDFPGLGGTGRIELTRAAAMYVGKHVTLHYGSEIDVRDGSLILGTLAPTNLVRGELRLVDPSSGFDIAGLLRGHLRNGGLIRPQTERGPNAVQGDFVQDPSGTLIVQSTRTGQFPVLAISGTARLGGRLELELPSGLTPQPGQFIPILTCRERIGTFVEVIGNRVAGTDFTYQPIYTRNGVFLEARLNPPEVIRNDPPEVGFGQTVVLNNPVFGPGPFTFQWLLNGVAIPGQTNQTLELPQITRAQGGDYTLVAASQAGVTVGPTDRVLFANSIEAREFYDTYPFTGPEAPTGDIESASGVLASRNSEASPDYESNEPLHAGVPGGRSVWISWRAPDSGVVTFDTQGSTFDTLLACYVWRPSLGQLSDARLDDDDDSGAYATSRIRFNARKGVTYVIAVSGYSAAPGETSSGDFILGWSLDTAAVAIPVIRSHPEGRSVRIGSTAQLRIESTGAESFQWFRRGSGTPVPLPGENGPALTLPDFSLAHVGEYIALLTASGGGTNWSRPARLEAGDDNLPLAGRPKRFFEPSLSGPALADLRPHSPLVSGFLPLASGFKAAPYPVGSGTREAQLRDCAARLTDGFWYGFQALTSGVVTMTCSNSIPLPDTFPVLGVYRDGDTSGNRVLQECSRATLGSGFTRVQFEAVANTTYLVVVGASGNHPDDALFHLSWETRSFRSVFAPAERASQPANSVRIRKLLPQGIVQFRKSAGFAPAPSQAIASPSDARWELLGTTNWTGGLLEWVQPLSTTSPTAEFFDLSWNGDFPSGGTFRPGVPHAPAHGGRP